VAGGGGTSAAVVERAMNLHRANNVRERGEIDSCHPNLDMLACEGTAHRHTSALDRCGRQSKGCSCERQ